MIPQQPYNRDYSWYNREVQYKIHELKECYVTEEDVAAAFGITIRMLWNAYRVYKYKGNTDELEEI